MEAHGEDFRWKTPPYEYEYERMPIDLISGDFRIRCAVDGGRSLLDLRGAMLEELDQFLEWRDAYLLYT
jgi:hypothetical protein